MCIAVEKQEFLSALLEQESLAGDKIWIGLKRMDNFFTWINNGQFVVCLPSEKKIGKFSDIAGWSFGCNKNERITL